MNYYEGKLVLISGASSGIGKALALGLAQLGARLILLGRKESALIETQVLCLKYTSMCNYYVGDIGDWETVLRMGSNIKESFGIPDIVVNNAGEGAFKSIADSKENEAELAIRSPYLSSFYWVQFFISDFKNRNSGTFVNVNAPAAYFPFPNTAAYSCTRAALRHLTRCLRLEMRGTNIRVQDVVPGLTASAYFTNNNMDWNKGIPEINQLLFKPLSPEEVAKKMIQQIPTRKKLICPQPLMKVLIYLSNYFPNLFDRLVSIQLKKVK
jgi:short-subunit dehydrogenase